MAAPVPTASLPAPPSRFIGRERELVMLRALLKKTRLLTLTGPGGVGKTRLSIELARTWPMDAARIRFVDVASVRDTEMLVDAVAEAVRIRARTPTRLERIANVLHQDEFLLLLDNCEGVVGPTARVVDQLLRTCPRLAVIATSREILGIGGETVWSVPPLSLPTVGASRTEVARSEAASLFVSRAADARPGFSLSHENMSTVAAICRLVEGVPLAVELAASRIRVMSEDEVLARLEQRLAFLTGGPRTAPKRQRSVRATIEWSYELLNDMDRALFRRLGVFAGGFDLAMAEHICVAPPIRREVVVDVLSSLIGKSLVEPATSEEAATRYRLLDTLREFALERLNENGEEATVRMRQLSDLTALAQRARASPDDSLLDESLELEADNVRSAVTWSFAAEPSLAPPLVAAALQHWTDHGRYAEARAWVGRSLEIETAPGETRLDLLGAAASFEWARGENGPAIALAREQVSIARAAGEPRLLVALNALAFIVIGAEDLTQAGPIVDEALTLAAHSNDDTARSEALLNDALLAAHTPDLDLARRQATRSLELDRRIGRASHLARSANLLGWVELMARDVGAARSAIEEGLRSRRRGDSRGVAASLYAAAELAALERHHERAVVLASAGDRLYAEAGEVPASLHRRSRARWYDATIRSLGARAEAAVARGRRLTTDHAIALALGDEAVVTGNESPASELTPRERELAELVAEGLTNAEIAQRLTLSERTIDAHLEHIRDKLGLRNRVEISRWVARSRNGRLAG